MALISLGTLQSLLRDGRVIASLLAFVLVLYVRYQRSAWRHLPPGPKGDSWPLYHEDLRD